MLPTVPSIEYWFQASETEGGGDLWRHSGRKIQNLAESITKIEAKQNHNFKKGKFWNWGRCIVTSVNLENQNLLHPNEPVYM